MYKKNSVSVQSYGKAVRRAQKVHFFSFHGSTCVNTVPKDQTSQPQISLEVSSHTTSGLFLSQIKYPTYRTRKPCPMAEVQKGSIKQVIKYTHLDHQGFWSSAWETTNKEGKDG